MEERVKITLSVSEETSKKIKELGALTHRADSHVVDWLVAEKFAELFHPAVSAETVPALPSVEVE